MGNTRRPPPPEPTPPRRRRRARDPEQRNNQLVRLAVDLVEDQLRDGTASAQVITHYIKEGSLRTRLEMERLERENKLLEAKVKDLESSSNSEELYKQAIRAMGIYRGEDEEDYDDGNDNY